MRINFDSSYSDITRFLKSFNKDSSNEASNDTSFRGTLSDILNDDENPKKIEVKFDNKDASFNTSKLSLENEEYNLKNMYALNLEDFKLEKMSDSVNYLMPPTTNEPKNIDLEDVKTPTIVSAKRIPTDNNLASNGALSQNVSSINNKNLKNIENFSNNAAPNNNLKINVDKIDKQIISQIIKEEGKKQGIDPALALAVAKVESSMNPMAVSSDGHYSKGLFQLLDSTGKELMANFANYEKYTPYDAKQNTSLGVNYLRELHQTFSDTNKLGNNSMTSGAIDADSLEKFAVAAFNAGQGRVALAQEKAYKAGKDPRIFDNVFEYLPNITKNYVQRVIQARKEYSENI